MKKRFYIGLIGLLLTACQSNDYKWYSGEAAIQFVETRDTIQRYSFYFQPEAVTQDTLWFEVVTTGYTVPEPRPFRVVQGQLEGLNNAVAGEHYKAFEMMDYVVGADAVKARVPVVLFRDKLQDKTTYYLELQIEGNDRFQAGVKTALKRRVVFSKDLMKPNGWSVYLENNILGAYSVNKHEWIIEQTKLKWDEDFFESLNNEPGSDMYWRDKLNALLVEFNQNDGVLLDDDNQEITGFPE